MNSLLVETLVLSGELYNVDKIKVVTSKHQKGYDRAKRLLKEYITSEAKV